MPHYYAIIEIHKDNQTLELDLLTELGWRPVAMRPRFYEMESSDSLDDIFAVLTERVSNPARPANVLVIESRDMRSSWPQQ